MWVIDCVEFIQPVYNLYNTTSCCIAVCLTVRARAPATINGDDDESRTV